MIEESFESVGVVGIRVFLQNVNKNRLHLDMLLELCKNDFDIIFVQEPPWSLICHAPSAQDVEGEQVIGAPNHPDWLAIVRPPDPGLPPRTMAYVSRRLAQFRPSLRRDVIDHRDILLLSLFSDGDQYNFLNIYSDSDHTAIDLLHDRSQGFPPCVYMGGGISTVTRHCGTHATGRIEAPLLS